MSANIILRLNIGSKIMIIGRAFAKIFLYLIVSAGICFSTSVSVSAFSVLEMLGIGTDETEESNKPDTGQKQDKSTANKPAAEKKTGKSSKQDKSKPSGKPQAVRAVRFGL